MNPVKIFVSRKLKTHRFETKTKNKKLVNLAFPNKSQILLMGRSDWNMVIS